MIENIAWICVGLIFVAILVTKNPWLFGLLPALAVAYAMAKDKEYDDMNGND